MYILQGLVPLVVLLLLAVGVAVAAKGDIMTVLIKLFYAVAVTALLILLVAFGVRTFYEGPEEPSASGGPPGPRAAVPVPCPALPTGREPTADERAKLEACLREQADAERAAFQEYEAQRQPYLEERADYRRNVFVIVGLLGLASVVSGVVTSSRLDAMRLGFVGGGLGLVIYGVAQVGDDLGEVGAAPIFIVAVIGLTIILAAGYLWLSGRLPSSTRGPGGTPQA